MPLSRRVLIQGFLVPVLAFSLSSAVVAEPVKRWESGSESTDTVELFTSEGCSSCPPADRWLSSLKSRPGVFQSFIPLAFHVDYWDYIGWKDRMADPAFSARQRDYVAAGDVSQAYTPGIVVNSHEWRDWFQGHRDWQSTPAKVGKMTATLDGQERLTVAYAGYQPGQRLNVAYLGMGMTSEVKAGENRGRELTHDFVVLDVARPEGGSPWSVTLPPRPQAGQARTALAVWVSPPGSPEIVQAVGGYLD
ncbi:DUF1223 domain-containing protein [Marinobacter sp. R17]|uniref:DUF1223 domain-containing protein n=1 Tax=Marinobacter sp. R17 TaxID=2484250 RepID=UPI000F4CC3FB|nr:DUF1223 domain-containing protein [Marinobacter sp. R17]ROT99970.1 DUF1223 domain-containing protein [Marinobacter sp. R17]